MNFFSSNKNTYTLVSKRLLNIRNIALISALSLCSRKNIICLSITFIHVPDLCPKISQDGHVSVTFLGYLL